MKRRMTKTEKAIDARIERTFYAHASGVQLNVFDIGKVFAAGRAAAVAGTDIDAAVLDAVARYRVN